MITEVEVGKKITYRYQTTLDKYFSYLLTNVSHSQNNLQFQIIPENYYRYIRFINMVNSQNTSKYTGQII